MIAARRVLCGALALLMSGWPLWLLLVSAGRPPGHGAVDATDLPRITVAVLIPPHTALEAAQPPPMNFAATADQTSRRDVAALPAAAPQRESFDAAAYLPASQLTEWPRQHPQVAPTDDDGDGPPRPATWGQAITVVAVLMIDEQGEVRHVQLDDDAIERPLRHWLEHRLMALRFVPGRLYGRPVGSRLALELVLQ